MARGCENLRNHALRSGPILAFVRNAVRCDRHGALVKDYLDERTLKNETGGALAEKMRYENLFPGVGHWPVKETVSVQIESVANYGKNFVASE